MSDMSDMSDTTAAGFNMFQGGIKRDPIENHWLVVSPPLKNVKVNWDDEIPNIWKNKGHVPVTTNQMICSFFGETI